MKKPNYEDAGPLYENGCNHLESNYVGWIYRIGNIPVDVYFFKEFDVWKYCFRYGDEDWEYESGEVKSLLQVHRFITPPENPTQADEIYKLWDEQMKFYNLFLYHTNSELVDVYRLPKNLIKNHHSGKWMVNFNFDKH